MRLLIAASGGEGHLGPLLPFAAAAHESGDEVVVVAPPEQEETVHSAGIPCLLSPGVPAAIVKAIRDAMATGSDQDRVLLAEVELFGRACTAAALPTVESACDVLRPDLVLREPCDYASAIAAHRRGIPMAQVAISPGHADWNGLHLAAAVIEPLAPGVTAAIERSPYLSRFPEADSGFADNRVYGFAVDVPHRHRERPPLVWITFGTVNSSFEALKSTWDAVLTAVAPLDLQVVASTGRHGPALRAPENVEVREWIPLADILERASAVISHGGSGTTLAALASGVPQVVIPLLADQPTNAAMIEELGAGIAIRSNHDHSTGVHGLTTADVPRIQAAIKDLLTNDRYRLAAERIARTLSSRPSVSDALHDLRNKNW